MNRVTVNFLIALAFLTLIAVFCLGMAILGSIGAPRGRVTP